jgi:hypothetical protein
MGTEQSGTKVPRKFRDVVLEKNVAIGGGVKKRPNESVLHEINETRKLLNTVKERRWTMIGNVPRREE